MPKLTKTIIDKEPFPSEGQTFLRDTETKGFGVRVTTGQKTFILEKRIQGRPRRIVIGPFPSLTVEAARKEADKLIGRIARGEDPAQDRIDKRMEFTFGSLEKLYLERHAPKKRTGDKDKYLIEKYFSKWRNRKMTSISRKDVADNHAKIGKNAPYVANRILALIKVMFNLANEWGIFNGENPASRIKSFPEESRDRFLNPDELKKVMKALSEENTYIQGIFLTTILTGARIGEVMSMKWDDLDLTHGIWTIPKESTKAKRVHRIPLPEPLAKRFPLLPRLEGNPYVFPSRIGNTHIRYPNKAWERVRERAKVKDIRIHDLRRTLGSWLAGSGASLPLIGKVLNHSQPISTQVYARLDLDPVRVALEENARRMIDVAGELPALKGSKDEEETDNKKI